MKKRDKTKEQPEAEKRVDELQTPEIQHERKELRVQEAREYAESIIDTLREPLIVLDQDLRVVAASRSFYDVFKVRPEETAGQLIYDLGNQQWDIPGLRELLESILPEKAAFDNYEVEHDFAAIGRRTMLLNARQIQRAPGKERVTLLAIEDVTERKQAEKSFLNSEEKYRLLFDNAGDAIFVADAEARILSVNPLACERLGYTHAELMSMTIDRVDSPAEASNVPDRLTRLMEYGHSTFETVHKRKDGLLIPTEINARRIVWDGQPAVMSICRDITSRKLAEDAIRESEDRKRLERDRLELILRTAQDGFWLVDASTGHIVDVNEAASFILGYTREELLKLRLTDIDAQRPPEEISQEMQKIKTTGGVFFETRHRTSGGQIIDVEISANYLPETDQFFAFIRDITNRKQVAKDLKESESLLKEAQHLAQIGHWELDPSIGTPVWSEEVFHIFGLDPAQGEPSFEDHRKIVHPDDWDILNNAITRSGIEGVPFDIEFRIVRPDKNIGWMNAKGHVTRDKEGNIVSLFGTAQDITERKLAEMLIQESEERYRMAIEHSNDGVALVQGGDHIYVNQKFLDIFGYEKPEDIIGKSPFITVHPDDRQMVMEHNLKRHRGEPVPSRYEFKGIRKDGTALFIEVSVANITYNREPVSLAYFRDITDRKKTEETLFNEKNKFLTLSESAPFGVVMIDREGKFIYINPKFKELFGYDREEVPDGKTWFQKTYPDPEYRKTVVSAWVEDLKRAEVGQKRPRIFKVRCKDDTEKIINFIPVQLETGEQMMSCDDITEQKRLEQQLHSMSLTDELTGLYNRRGFITLSEQQLKIAVRTKKDMLLFFADLDKMKDINDALGHQAGDMALVEVAAILKEVFRESDIIGRMGGDEFAVLAIDATDEAGEVLTDRLQKTLDNYNRPDGRNYTLSLSIGTGRYDPERPCSLDELMAQADTLMYEEKRNKQH